MSNKFLLVTLFVLLLVSSAACTMRGNYLHFGKSEEGGRIQEIDVEAEEIRDVDLDDEE